MMHTGTATAPQHLVCTSTLFFFSSRNEGTSHLLILLPSDVKTDLQITRETCYITLQKASVTGSETLLACMYLFYFVSSLWGDFCFDCFKIFKNSLSCEQFFLNIFNASEEPGIGSEVVHLVWGRGTDVWLSPSDTQAFTPWSVCPVTAFDQSRSSHFLVLVRCVQAVRKCCENTRESSLMTKIILLPKITSSLPPPAMVQQHRGQLKGERVGWGQAL